MHGEDSNNGGRRPASYEYTEEKGLARSGSQSDVDMIAEDSDTAAVRTSTSQVADLWGRATYDGPPNQDGIGPNGVVGGPNSDFYGTGSSPSAANKNPPPDGDASSGYEDVDEKHGKENEIFHSQSSLPAYTADGYGANQSPSRRRRKRRTSQEELKGIEQSNSRIRNLIPKLYVMFAGLVFAFNSLTEINDVLVRELLMLKYCKIEILGLAHMTKNERGSGKTLVLSILGLRIGLSYNDEVKLRLQFMPKAIGLYMTLLLFGLMYYFSSQIAIPVILGSLVPFWSVSVWSLSLLDIVITHQAFMACLEVFSAIVNSVKHRFSDRFIYWSETLLYFFHPKILCFGIMIPALVCGFYPLQFSMASLLLVSYFDARLQQEDGEKGIFIYRWDFLMMTSMSFYGYLFNDVGELKFHYFSVDLGNLVLPDVFKTSFFGSYVEGINNPPGLSANDEKLITPTLHG